MIAAEARGMPLRARREQARPAGIRRAARAARAVRRAGLSVVECAASEDVAPLAAVARAISARCSSASPAWASRRSSMRWRRTPARASARSPRRCAPAGTRRRSRRSIRCPRCGDDGWIVDSPGMKAFGLAHVAPAALEQAFVEMRPLLGHCRFRDCRHDREPGCAVTAAVDAGRVEAIRVALLHALKRESAQSLITPARAASGPVHRIPLDRASKLM